MKKSIDHLLQYKSHFPNKGEFRTFAMRAKKDKQTLGWLMGSKQGADLIELYRKLIGLPKNGITPSTEQFRYIDEIPNYPTPTLYPEFNPERLQTAVHYTLKAFSLSSRFIESVKSILIFGKPLELQPPAVVPQIVIRNVATLKKELLIRLYPGATFKEDIRSSWHLVVLSQQELSSEIHRKKWKFLIHKESIPIEETVFIYSSL